MTMVLQLLVSSVICASVVLSTWINSINETVQVDLRDYVLPTSMMQLNRSAALELIQEANNKFVSNTSLSEIINDNETHHLILRYRERKRQMRIYNIQQDILQRLGISRGPNITAYMSAEERNARIQSYERTFNDITDYTNITDGDHD